MLSLGSPFRSRDYPYVSSYLMARTFMRYSDIGKPVDAKRRNEQERRGKRGRIIGGLKELKTKSHVKHGCLRKGGKTCTQVNTGVQ